MKRNKYLIFIFVIMTFMFVPKHVFAKPGWVGPIGTYNQRWNGNENEFKDNDGINNIPIASYSDGTTLNENSGGTYNLRYDITHVGIDSSRGNNLLQIYGWGIIKDYNNGEAGIYAPTYYLKLYDINNPSEYNIYKYEGNKKSGFNANELNVKTGKTYYPYVNYDNQCGNIDTSGTSIYSEHYDNAEFVFNEMNLDNFPDNDNDGLVNIGIQLMIVIPEIVNNGNKIPCTKYRTDWFNVGLYDVNNGNESKLDNDTNGRVSVYKTNEVKFVATLVGGFSPNETYTITKMKDPIRYQWATKYNYTIAENGKNASSRWVQNNPENKITITVKKNNDCINLDNLTEDEKTKCCENVTIADANREYCCDKNYINNENKKKEVCCAGDYGYKYAYYHKGACCEYLPETCCDDDEFINNNWGKYWRLSSGQVCCYNVKFKGTYYGIKEPETYEFPSFYTSGKTGQYSKCSDNNTNPQKCSKGSTTNTKSKQIAIDIEYKNNKIKKSDTYKIETNKNNLSDITKENIGWDINYISPNLNTSKLGIKIMDASYDRNGVVTFKVEYTYDLDDTLLAGNYRITLNFYVCLSDDDSTVHKNNCSKPSYFNNNKAICCSYNEYKSNPECQDSNIPDNKPDISNLTCNSENDAYIIKRNIKNTSDTYGSSIICDEKLEFKNFKTSEYMLEHPVYSGTGFKYDITIDDTITCQYNFNTSYTSNDHDDLIKYKHTSETTLQNTMNKYFNGSNIGEIQFNSDSSYKYKLNGNINKNNNIEFTPSYVTLYYWNIGAYNNVTTESDTAYLNTSAKKTATYTITLPEQYIDRLTGELKNSNSDSSNNLINAGNKYYTDIDDDTGFYNFYVDFKNAGLSKMVAGQFSCIYAAKNILTTGGNITPESVEENSIGNQNYLTRPISLSQPFNTVPSGNGRATNWYSTDRDGSRYIKNTATEIYTKPMYEFTLEPGNISTINNYNKNNKYK